MTEWMQQLRSMLQCSSRLVMVTVASVKGSTPREPGARMLVSVNEVSNTIGGGHLEYKSIRLARNMLAQDLPNECHRFSLGATLGQCCGGVVTLFFEVVTDRSVWLHDALAFISHHEDFVQVIPLANRQELPRLLVTENCIKPDYLAEFQQEYSSLVSIARTMLKTSEATAIKRVGNIDYFFDPIIKSDFNIYVFGGGHVGAAVVKYLAELPCYVNWVDSRDQQLPDVTPTNVNAINTDIPDAVIDEAPAGSYFLVMTHDHGVDQVLAETILKRDDFSYFGLIGSLTKRKKFEHRLLDRGINAKQLSRMTCPIGISGINSKRPAVIALAVTAELVQCYETIETNQKYPVGQAENHESNKL